MEQGESEGECVTLQLLLSRALASLPIDGGNPGGVSSCFIVFMLLLVHPVQSIPVGSRRSPQDVV